MSAPNSRKIALFTSSLRAGGGEKMMVELARAFAARGYDVDLVVMKRDGALISQIDPKVRLVDLAVGRIIGAAPKLAGYLRREAPEVIMSVDEYSHLLSLWAARRAGGRTRVALRVGNMYSELFRRYRNPKDRFVVPFLVRRWYRRADVIIAVSKGVAADITAVTGVDPRKVVVIHNPKDLDRIRELAGEPTGHVWLERKTLPLVIAVGRLREQKNFGLIIRAFANVSREVPARLLVVGVGREEARLRDLVRELGLSASVSLPGYAANPYAFLSAADVFVAASLWEGMPNAHIEAMVCGCPVVASDCQSGPRELLAPSSDFAARLGEGSEDAEFGILAAVGDQAALESALRRMLSDSALRARYHEASLRRVADFGMERGAAAYLAALGVAPSE